MKKLLLSLVLIISFAQGNAQLSAAYTARLQFVLDSVCTHYKIKGASAAVLVPGVGVWKGAHGESYTGHPINTDMIFGIGSNTKTFVSATMLKVQEMGMVSLDDTIGTWIHGYPNINGQITIRQLLNHTSGLYNYTLNPAFADSIVADFNRIWQPEEMLQFVSTPNFAPGTSWDYSNTNYIIAGLILKQVLGQPANVMLHDMIFAPQGLNHTICFPADTTSATIPRPWSVNLNNAGIQEDLIATYGYSNNAFFSAASTAGCIMSTAEDNVQFWHHLISGDIIDTTSLHQMLQFVPIGTSLGHAVGYGLGIFRYENFMNGHTVYTHGGTMIGYISENVVDSVTGVCISVLTNQDSIDNDILSLAVVSSLHKVTLHVSPTGVATVTNKASMLIYPNPASDVIKVQVPVSVAATQFRLFDMSGRCVLARDISNKLTTISVAALPSGSYIANLVGQDAILQTQKIQIVK